MSIDDVKMLGCLCLGDHEETVLQMNSHQILRSRAKMIAFPTAIIFVGESVVIR